MGLLGSSIKCCGCILLSQLLSLIFFLGALLAFALIFAYYAVPWGEDQIRDLLNLKPDADISNLDPDFLSNHNCTGCVLGNNEQWPTNSTGGLHFLDTSAGTTVSVVAGASMAAAAAMGVISMLLASLVPSIATAASTTASFYEMTHIVEQAQFISMIAQLQIEGAPAFLMEFSKELSWTNFNLPLPFNVDYGNSQDAGRRLMEVEQWTGLTGPERYASMIDVAPESLFYYTLSVFAALIAAFHIVFIFWVCILAIFVQKSVRELMVTWYRKVIWASLLALLLVQYTITMSGTYFIHQSNVSKTPLLVGIIVVCLFVGAAVLFGTIIIARNRAELEDIGTMEHDMRPFSNKYSAYYDEYNFSNRFFFIPRIALAVTTGAIVGLVEDPTSQVVSLLGVYLVYLVLVVIREPNLLRFLFYISATSTFLKLVLLCMILMLVRDDYFPQHVRDNVAYVVIGLNLVIFGLLVIRQIYSTIAKIVRACSHRSFSKDVSTDVQLERGDESHYLQVTSPGNHQKPTDILYREQKQQQISTSSRRTGSEDSFLPPPTAYFNPHEYSDSCPTNSSYGQKHSSGGYELTPQRNTPDIDIDDVEVEPAKTFNQPALASVHASSGNRSENRDYPSLATSKAVEPDTSLMQTAKEPAEEHNPHASFDSTQFRDWYGRPSAASTVDRRSSLERRFSPWESGGRFPSLAGEEPGPSFFEARRSDTDSYASAENYYNRGMNVNVSPRYRSDSDANSTLHLSALNTNAGHYRSSLERPTHGSDADSFYTGRFRNESDMDSFASSGTFHPRSSAPVFDQSGGYGQDTLSLGDSGERGNASMDDPSDAVEADYPYQNKTAPMSMDSFRTDPDWNGEPNSLNDSGALDNISSKYLEEKRRRESAMSHNSDSSDDTIALVENYKAKRGDRQDDREMEMYSVPKQPDSTEEVSL